MNRLFREALANPHGWAARWLRIGAVLWLLIGLGQFGLAAMRLYAKRVGDPESTFAIGAAVFFGVSAVAFAAIYWWMVRRIARGERA